MKNKKLLIGFLVILFLLGLIGLVRALISGERCSLSSNIEEGVQYKNVEYGFVFDLPDNWRGYSIVTGTWSGLDVSDNEQMRVTGPMVSIRSPLWTEEIPRQDIPILIVVSEQWNKLLADKLYIGAAPINPSELGRNDNYVFALPARYNFAFPEGFEEVDEILKANSLRGL